MSIALQPVFHLHPPLRRPSDGGVRSLVVRIATMAALLQSAGACGDTVAVVSEATVADSAGVEIVTSGGEDRTLALALEADYRLGGRDDDVESFYQVSGYSVAVSEEGLIAVLDRDNHRVVVFDSDGEHVRSVGREGEGPGELSWPVGLFWTDDRELMVQDIAKRGLVGYDRDGHAIDGPRLPEDFRGGRVVSDSSGLVFLVNDMGAGEQRLMRKDGSGEARTLVTLSQPAGKPVEFKSCGLSVSSMPPLFTPSIRWTATPEGLIVVDGAEYAVDTYRDGRLVRSVRRNVAPRAATLELAVAEVGEGMRVMTGAGPLVCEPDDVAEERGWADVIPAIETVAVAPDGTLWVGRWALGNASQAIDLFDPDGAYRGTLPPETPFPVGFLPDGRILWTETDELEVQRLVVGRMVATDVDGSVE